MGRQFDDAATEGRSKLLAVGVPALLAVGALVAVPFVLGGAGNDSIASTDETTSLAVTTTAPPTVVANDVFSATDNTIEYVPVVTAATTTAVPPTVAPTTTTAPITIPDTLPAQPAAPIAPPADPRAFEDQIQLGGISIPKLGVDAPLLEGIRLTTLDNGPGHWPGTAMPGEVGNVVVAAHRTSHGGPFRNIDQLVAGDAVLFNTDAGEVEYLVTGTQIVEPDAIWIVDPTDTPTATLFACHPPGSVAQRIVVHLELAG